ncbi:MAG: hypothetical protein J5985_02510 [Kiritimatiellae bacterium]|nr:hypothetical protein [Kiritimatiellia bacterium]
MTRPRRNILFCLLAAVLCLSAIVAFAQDVFLRPALEDFIDKDTKLVFPAIVDTFQKVRVRKNENPVFGTVVRYENEAGTCADVYIYSLDTGAKEVGVDEFEKHFQETDQGILKLAEQNARIKAVTRLETPDRKTTGPGREARYRIDSVPDPMDSILYLALYHGKLVKLRVSYAPDDKDEAEHAGLFIDAVSAMLVEKPQEAKRLDSVPETSAATAAAAPAQPAAHDAAKDSNAPGA